MPHQGYKSTLGDEIRQILVNWIVYLKVESFGGMMIHFSPRLISIGASQQFEAQGLKRKHWSTASPIRTVFKETFAKAGLPYLNPHSFRNTLVQLGQLKCKTPEAFKAWSQNLGHESVLTTLYSYGEDSMQRQAEILNNLGHPEQNKYLIDNDLADAIVQKLMSKGVKLPA